MIKLNCDLGESFGAWQMGQDAKVMPLIDQANIACGMHASDPLTLLNTVRLANQYGVEIGAHPGYPDKEGFGRRAMELSSDEIYALVLYQIAALDGVSKSQGTEVGYVKPHGALYHAMMKKAEVRSAILQAVADYPGNIPLVMLANSEHEQYRKEASNLGVTLRFEAFADRGYLDSGQLIPRNQAGAVHKDISTVIAQAQQIAMHRQVTTQSGERIQLPADTLCVHGDNEHALEALRGIRTMLEASQ